MRDMAKIVKKYADFEITEDAIYDRNATPTVRAIGATVEKIDQAERTMLRAAEQLRDLANKVVKNVEAEAGERIYTLNPLGELQGEAGRIDSLIRHRAALIEQLQLLVHLSREAPKAEATPEVAIPNGTKVIVTPTGHGRKPFLATVTGAIAAASGVGWYWVEDENGQEHDVLPAIVQRAVVTA